MLQYLFPRRDALRKLQNSSYLFTKSLANKISHYCNNCLFIFFLRIVVNFLETNSRSQTKTQNKKSLFIIPARSERSISITVNKTNSICAAHFGGGPQSAASAQTLLVLAVSADMTNDYHFCYAYHVNGPQPLSVHHFRLQIVCPP